MKQATGHSPRAILALDLKGAFDNVSHVGILTNLQSTGCGERVYNYVRGFLTDRKARNRVGEEVSLLIELGSSGTPQGSVLSPLLFNVALLHLPKALEAIEGLGHALYADDVSLWTTKAGSHGWMQDTLQTAAEVVDKYA
ncbi:putative nicotine oxidoreductase [Dermacentor silvarum]|uniref:putative nicotine oxidoreductase n=1 Tax=Dermacentor silvarum TaxID=543639 RepID=UPI00189AB0D2|nr:putative nicotine oxidoreductase [Dermacentor silvarum]